MFKMVLQHHASINNRTIRISIFVVNNNKKIKKRLNDNIKIKLHFLNKLN